MSNALEFLHDYATKLDSDKKSAADLWPKQFINKKTGKTFIPHNEDAKFFVESYEPKRMLVCAGESAGKTTMGVIKTLNNLCLGLNGLMGAPDFPHLRRSTWKEFCNWCPEHVVIERHRHRLKDDWIPVGNFEMVFINKYGTYSTLQCGGFIENQMGAWEGPNLSFVYFDEARRHKTPIALKVLEGRVRIPGPNQEPPQFYITTTPRKHWLYDYFGPIQKNDKFEDFKKNSFVCHLTVEMNRDNLAAGFIEDRRQSLSESEARILIDGEWEDESDTARFVEMAWWDNCEKEIPKYEHEPCVIAIDASKGSMSTNPDSAALVLVTRHPKHHDVVIPRHIKIWKIESGTEFDYELLTEEIKILREQYAIIEYAYDPYQLAYWAQTMRNTLPGYYREFGQMSDRLKSDSALQLMIMSQRIYHDGNEELRQHISNANCKKYRAYDSEESGYRIRIIKRNPSLKVDSAVALSMACHRAMFYNIV